MKSIPKVVQKSSEIYVKMVASGASGVWAPWVVLQPLTLRWVCSGVPIHFLTFGGNVLYC